MIVVTRMFMLVMLVSNVSYTMDTDVETEETKKPLTFDASVADLLLNDFHSLSNYLYKYVDCVKDFSDLYDYDDDCIGNWIDARSIGSTQGDSKDLNAVCLYFYARNHLEKTSAKIKNQKKFLTSQDFGQTLIAMILCLQRTLFDSIRYYKVHRDACIFGNYFGLTGAYTIMKKKFYYLLTYYLPSKTDFSKYPDFNEVCTTALTFWQEHEVSTQAHPYTWVKGLQWSHWWMPAWSWGIYFAPETQEQRLLDVRLSEDEVKQIFEFVKTVFTKQSSWTQFFKNFEFPIAQVNLEASFDFD